MISDAKWLSSIISAPLLSNASSELAWAAISASNAWCFCILAYSNIPVTANIQQKSKTSCNQGIHKS